MLTKIVKIRKISIRKLLYIIFCFELILGGGGWLFKINGISLRMMIFAIIIFAFLIEILARKKNIMKLPFYLNLFILLSLSIFMFFGVFYGSIRGTSLSYIIGDSNAFIYPLIIIPFFYWANYEKWSVNFFLLTFAIPSIIVAFTSNILFFIMQLHPLSIPKIYFFSQLVGDLLGCDMYVGLMPDGAIRVMSINSLFLIPLFFFFLLKQENLKSIKKFDLLNLLLSIITIFAIFTTYSRGIWMAIITSFLFYLILSKSKKNTFFYLVVMIIVFAAASLFFQKNLFLALLNRLKSSFNLSDIANSKKISEIKKILPSIFENPLLGYGFGYSNPSFISSIKNPYSYEVTLLDITMKIGLIGDLILMFTWTYIFLHLFHLKTKFIKLKSFFHYETICFVIVSLVGILIAGLFNPFLNSSVGMGAISLLLILPTLLNTSTSLKKDKI